MLLLLQVEVFSKAFAQSGEESSDVNVLEGSGQKERGVAK